MKKNLDIRLLNKDFLKNINFVYLQNLCEKYDYSLHPWIDMGKNSFIDIVFYDISGFAEIYNKLNLYLDIKHIKTHKYVEKIKNINESRGNLNNINWVRL